LRVVLDCHRTQLGAGANPNGLWYDHLYSEQAWIDRWVALARRYKNNPTVVGMDLFNEPHAVGATGGAAWDDGVGGRADWRLAAERAGNAILAVNPKLLIIVEGVGDSPGVTAFYGANLTEAKAKPVRLSIPNRLVYSPHDYGQLVFDHTWFHDATYPMNLYKVWNDRWGYLYWNNIAPIWLGEFGSTLDTTIDQQWYTELLKYLGGDKNGDGRSDLRGKNLGMSWAHFAVNPSVNPGGVLQPDWQTPIGKIVIPLTAIQQSLPPATSNQVIAFTVALERAAPVPVSVRYRTANGSARAGQDFVATVGTLVLAPGETRKVVHIPLLGDTVAEGSEFMKLVLSAPKNARLVSTVAIGTIIDDDAAIRPIQIANVVDAVDQVSFDIVLTNTTPEVISGWQLALGAAFRIESLTGATLRPSTGREHILTAAPANPPLLPYETQTIHLVAKPGTSLTELLRSLVWSYEWVV
jgi:hypothetical protein